MERYRERLAGVLSCYDRIIVTGTLPGACYADGMTAFLSARQVRIFDYPRFAEPLRDRVRERAAELAAGAGISIEHIANSHIRKEDVVAKVLATRGDHPGLVHVISAMEACPTYKPWHSKDIALGVRADGTKEILGLWLEQNEGAKFWLRVMNELKNRGVEDVLIAVVDGLKGFPEAITAVFPHATVQTCIVHLLRHSLDFGSWKDRKPVAAALKEIYRAVDADAGEAALTAFEESSWGKKYPAIGQSWRRAWAEVIPFYAFASEVRRILYTTNAIEALNAKLRRAVRARGHFSSDDAATRLLFLVLNRSEKQWMMPPREWSMAKSQFAVLFGQRFTMAMV